MRASRDIIIWILSRDVILRLSRIIVVKERLCYPCCHYLDHFRRCRIRAEIRGGDQVVRRSRSQSKQHPPMFLSGDRLGLHRDQDRAVLTVPSHEVHVFLRIRKRSQDDKTSISRSCEAIMVAISHGFRYPSLKTIRHVSQGSLKSWKCHGKRYRILEIDLFGTLHIFIDV